MNKDYDALNSVSKQFNETLDCGVIALAVSCDVSYEEAHTALELAGRKKGKPTNRCMYVPAASLFNKKLVLTNKFKSRTIRTLERELDDGNYLVRVTGHAAGVYNGKVVDWSTGRCKRIKEIYEVVDNV
jgi:hypothetical protein